MDKNKKKFGFGLTLVISALLIIVCFVFAACGQSSSSGDVSNTNNQTAGVDESDIVKVTSDGYIFKAQSDGVTVSKADNGQIILVKKEIYSNFTPCEMFVAADSLIILGNKKVPISGTSAVMTKSEIKIYNIDACKSGDSNCLIRTSEFFGTFYTARIVSDKMYVVLNISYTNNFADTPIYYFHDSYQGIRQFDIINDLDNSKASKELYTNGFIIVKYDLSEIAVKDILAKFYAGEDISDLYCSPYAVYAISWHSEKSSKKQGCGYYPYMEGSKVSKISLADLSLQGNIIYYDSNILNRYSLYDNGLVLYIVSTEWSTIVSAYDQNLKFLGASDDFAYGENVYSVRFEEDICYVVTFRQTDPLFKIDISNPVNIKILGELKIDGYSSYLQVFGDNYLMGLGFETDLRAAPTGLKLTLFGTLGSEPTEITSILFSQNYGLDSKSEATSNPKAILCEPDKNIFAFPVQYKLGNAYYQGAVVYGIIDGQLEELAFLTNYEEGVLQIDPDKNIIRIVRVENYLYAISDKFITSYSLTDFSKIGTFET